MKITRKVFGELAEIIFEAGAKKAVRFFGDKLRVKATRTGRIDKSHKSIEIRFNIGPPNYAERQFIRNAQKTDKKFLLQRPLIVWPVGK